MEQIIDHSKDLSDIFTKMLFQEGDIKILLSSEKPEDQYLSVVSYILKCQSNVFRTMLESEMLEKSTNTIDLSMYHPLVVQKVIRYMYTGKITIPSSPELVFEILNFANMYEIMHLKDEMIKFCLSMVNEKNHTIIREIAITYGVLAEEIIYKCDEYTDGTAELRELIKKHHIIGHHFSENDYYDFKKSPALCDSDLFKKIIKSNHKIYFVPDEWDSYRDAYLYKAVLDVDMKKRFPFLGDSWEKYFWQLKMYCPGSYPHLKIKWHPDYGFYYPSITNIYGLKSIDLNHITYDLEDEVIKDLIREKDGDFLHDYFYDKLKN